MEKVKPLFLKLISTFSDKDELAASSRPCHDYAFFVQDKVQPIQVQVLLNYIRVNMELDTGASLSIMSKSTCERFWSIDVERSELHPSSFNLKVYGGSPLKCSR